MKKQIITALAAAALSLSALAGNGILVNEYVKAGVNETTGTLGSGGNTSPGLLYDSTGSGTFNTSYDYLTPGTPFEGYGIKGFNSSNTLLFFTHNNNSSYSSSNPITGAWIGTPTASSAIWESTSNSNFNLRHTYSLPSGIQYIDIATRIEAKVAIDNLYFSRFIDPDARAATGDSSSTDNVRGYGIIPKTNVVFSEALASRYALGLYSVATSGVNTSISPSWSTNPTDYYNNTSGHDVVRGDYTIGISFYSTGLAVGDIVTYNYAYIFGPSAFGAATTAIAGGAAGGTAGTSSFGTLVDVGSATSAASGSPTVTGTSTATITVSDTTVASTTLPVVTSSLAHHVATESGTKQTIARETTTYVTTPMERTLITKVRTTTAYSDSTTTYSDSAASTSVTVSNSLSSWVIHDSFSGRIDQHDQLGELNIVLNKNLNMDPFRTDVYKTEKGHFFVRGGNNSTAMNDGYSATSNQFSVGAAKQINPKWSLGGQVGRVDTKMQGVDSYTTQNKNVMGAYSIYVADSGAVISTNLGYAKNDITSNRNVENVWNNFHNTNGTDIWLSNRVYAPTLDEKAVSIRPFVGYTVNRSTRNTYTEGGDIQSVRTVAAYKKNIDYGELGVKFTKNVDKVTVTGEVSGTSNGLVNAEVGALYSPKKNQSIGVSAAKQIKDDQVTTGLFLKGTIKF